MSVFCDKSSNISSLLHYSSVFKPTNFDKRFLTFFRRGNEPNNSHEGTNRCDAFQFCFVWCLQVMYPKPSIFQGTPVDFTVPWLLSAHIFKVSVP